MTAAQQAASTEFRVFTDDNRFVGFRTGDQLRRMVAARQVKAIPIRRGQLRYVLSAQLSADVRSILDNDCCSIAGLNGQQSTMYREPLNALTGSVTSRVMTLKRVAKDGTLVRWPADECFRPGRFNPDTLPKPFFGHN